MKKAHLLEHVNQTSVGGELQSDYISKKTSCERLWSFGCLYFVKQIAKVLKEDK
jgi:hypothetical protein